MRRGGGPRVLRAAQLFMPSEGAQKRKFELSAAESSKSSASVERKGDTG